MWRTVTQHNADARYSSKFYCPYVTTLRKRIKTLNNTAQCKTDVMRVTNFILQQGVSWYS
jgi:hypothetical protein